MLDGEKGCLVSEEDAHSRVVVGTVCSENELCSQEERFIGFLAYFSSMLK